MKFEIKHTFRAEPQQVADTMFHPEVGKRLTRDMETIIEVEPLSRGDEGGAIQARVRYLPKPLIRKVGTKEVDPKWMEWVAEFAYDPAEKRGTFRNVPTTHRIAELMANDGTLELRAASGGGTERVLTGELKVKVPLLGKIAERIIHKNAVKILDEEARVMQKIIDEGGL